MAASTVAPAKVLNRLINDGLFDTLRKSITAELEGNTELRRFTIEEVERSRVLQTPGAERRSRRELFESLRRELQTKVLERASEAAWHAILSKDGVGFQIEEQVEKTWWELNGWGMPTERTFSAEQKGGVAHVANAVSESEKEVTGQVEQSGVDESKGLLPDRAMAVPLVPGGSAAQLSIETPLAMEVQYVPLSVDADSGETAPVAATTAGMVHENVGVLGVAVSRELESVEMAFDSSSGAPGQDDDMGIRQDAADNMTPCISRLGVEVAEGTAPEGLASAFVDGKAAGEIGGDIGVRLHQESTQKEEEALENPELEGEVAGGLEESASERGEVDASKTGGVVRQRPSGNEAEQLVQGQNSVGAELLVPDACETSGIGSLVEGGGLGGIASCGPETVEGQTGVLLAQNEVSPSGGSREMDTSNLLEMQGRGSNGVSKAEHGAEGQKRQAGEGQEESGQLVVDSNIPTDGRDTSGEGTVGPTRQGNEGDVSVLQDFHGEGAAIAVRTIDQGLRNQDEEDVVGGSNFGVVLRIP